MKNLFFICITVLSLILTGCSNNLKSQFDECYAKKISPIELLQNKKVKERIVKNYSQQYYDKLLANADVYTKVYYDSLYNCYYTYGLKKGISNEQSSTQLRYYLNNDSLSTTLRMFNVIIDKSGESDYAGWKENPKQYIESLRVKAEQGNSTAQYILGYYYSFLDEEVISPDLNLARDWFAKSATQGNSDAQWNLGLLLSIKDTPESQEKGIALLKEAAFQGNYEAQDYLGFLNYAGKWMPENGKEAIRWWSMMLEHSGEIMMKGLFQIGTVYQYIIQMYNERKAVEYYQAAANLGYVKAQRKMAMLYLRGDLLVGKDFEKVKEWLRMAAEEGNDKTAQAILVRIYLALSLSPNSTEADTQEYQKWMQKAKSNPQEIDEQYYNSFVHSAFE